MASPPIWDDHGRIKIGLWNQLVYWNYFNPAVALLQECFAELLQAEAAVLHGPAAKVHQETCAKLREDLMEITGATDGHLLNEWLDAYRADDGTLEPLVAQRFDEVRDELLK